MAHADRARELAHGVEGLDGQAPDSQGAGRSENGASRFSLHPRWRSASPSGGVFGERTGESGAGFASQVAEDLTIFVASRTEHGVEPLGVLGIEGELTAALFRPGLPIAREPNDDPRQPPEQLAELDRPRAWRIRALQDPRVSVADALQVRQDVPVPARGARVFLQRSPFAVLGE